MVKESTPTSDIEFKAHRIVTVGGFWFSESSEKNRRCKKYGITPAVYNKLFNKQEGSCTICGVQTFDFHIKVSPSFKWKFR